MDVKLPKKQEQEHMASFIISIPKPRQSDSNELDSMRTCHGPCRKRVEELNFNLELVHLVLSKNPILSSFSSLLSFLPSSSSSPFTHHDHTTSHHNGTDNSICEFLTRRKTPSI